MRHHLRLIAVAVLVVLSHTASAEPSTVDRVEQWGIFEIELKGPTAGNPFVDVRLVPPSSTTARGRSRCRASTTVTVSTGSASRRTPRAAWSYETRANRWDLTGKTGKFIVSAAGQRQPRPGARRTTRTTSPTRTARRYKQIGTTIYNWIDTPDDVAGGDAQDAGRRRRSTRRACCSRSSRRRTEPVRAGRAGRSWAQPPRDWDLTRFNPDYFRHYEKRIGQLRDLGIEADVILFNPYGKWGFETMDADARRPLRALRRRPLRARSAMSGGRSPTSSISCAPRPTRTGIGSARSCSSAILPSPPLDPQRHAAVRPQQALDHARQHAERRRRGDAGQRRALPRCLRKPVVYDEVKYEGDAKYRWADLTGFDMVHRFWCGTVGGTYVGHGDYFNTLRRRHLDVVRRQARWPERAAPGLPAHDHGRRARREDSIRSTSGTTPTRRPAGVYYLTYFGRTTPTRLGVPALQTRRRPTACGSRST